MYTITLQTSTTMEKYRSSSILDMIQSRNIFLTCYICSHICVICIFNSKNCKLQVFFSSCTADNFSVFSHTYRIVLFISEFNGRLLMLKLSL